MASITSVKISKTCWNYWTKYSKGLNIFNSPVKLFHQLNIYKAWNRNIWCLRISSGLSNLDLLYTTIDLCTLCVKYVNWQIYVIYSWIYLLKVFKTNTIRVCIIKKLHQTKLHKVILQFLWCLFWGHDLKLSEN